MNEHLSLREIMKRVRQASLCPRCGKSTFVAATGWRGHGTGRGSSYYGATSFEEVTPETHCTCTPEQKAQSEKQARFEELCTRGDALTDEELSERVALFYELHPGAGVSDPANDTAEWATFYKELREQLRAGRGIPAGEDDGTTF